MVYTLRAQISAKNLLVLYWYLDPLGYKLLRYATTAGWPHHQVHAQLQSAPQSGLLCQKCLMFKHVIWGSEDEQAMILPSSPYINSISLAPPNLILSVTAPIWRRALLAARRRPVLV